MLRQMAALASKFVRDEDGLTAVGYGVCLALIVAVVIGAVAVLGGGMGDTFTETGTAASAP